MKDKIPAMRADLRAQLATTLPDALTNALQSYQTFTTANATSAVDDFKNHHTAAKAGLAHIELLYKLAQSIDEIDNHSHEDLVDVLKIAQQELEGHNE